MEADTTVVACRSYTHARRYPWVIGRIGGWQLPTQLTLTQLGAMAAALVLLTGTRAVWAHLPRAANLGVEAAVAALSAWAVRRARMEGRSPARALLGAASYLVSPRGGRVHGRPLHLPGPAALRSRIFVAPHTPADRSYHRP